MNRGVEIDSAVADGGQAVILPQVTFGIAVRMAVMSMLGGHWTARQRFRPHEILISRTAASSIPANRTDSSDLYIADGKIVAVGNAAGFPRRARSTPAAWSSPRLDHRPRRPPARARLRIPRHLRSEMDAAMAGGVTSLAIPPDTDPVLDEPGLVEMLCYRARSSAAPTSIPVGALTIGLRASASPEMAELVEAGCVAFQQANVPILDTRVLMPRPAVRRHLRLPRLAAADRPVSCPAAARPDGEVASRLGLPGIPVSCRTVALFPLSWPASPAPACIHPPVVRRSLALIGRPAPTVDVTCDVAIQPCTCATWTSAASTPTAHLIPPLRSQRDRDRAGQPSPRAASTPSAPDHTRWTTTPSRPRSSESLLLPLTLKWAAEHQAAADRCAGPDHLLDAARMLAGIASPFHPSFPIPSIRPSLHSGQTSFPPPSFFIHEQADPRNRTSIHSPPTICAGPLPEAVRVVEVMRARAPWADNRRARRSGCSRHTPTVRCHRRGVRFRAPSAIQFPIHRRARRRS